MGVDLNHLTARERCLRSFFLVTITNEKQWGKSSFSGSSKLTFSNKSIFFNTMYICTLYMQFSELSIVWWMNYSALHINLDCDLAIASLFYLFWKYKHAWVLTNHISQISKAASSATFSILINCYHTSYRHIFEIQINFIFNLSKNEGFFLLQLLRRAWKCENVISVYTKNVQQETKMSFRLTVFQTMSCFVDGKEELTSWFWIVRMAI